jgi:hypothetical protein
MRLLQRRSFLIPALAALLLTGCGGGSAPRTAVPIDTTPTDTSSAGVTTTAPTGPTAWNAGSTPRGDTSTGSTGGKDSGPATAGGTTSPAGTRTRTGTFAGYFVSGFEVSSFVPCGQGDRPGYGVGWWLVSQTPGFNQRYRDVLGPKATEPVTPVAGQGADHVVYLRFTGRLEQGAKGYGHLGAYRGQIVVTSLLEMTLGGRCPGMQGAPPS